MAWISPSAAEELKGEMVDPWCEWPGLDAEEPRQVESVAKLILTSRQPGQSYDLGCRSSTPGRPLKWIRRYYHFPTLDEVMRGAELLDSPEKLYISASKPTWRIIWTFDREPVGWEHPNGHGRFGFGVGGHDERRTGLLLVRAEKTRGEADRDNVRGTQKDTDARAPASLPPRRGIFACGACDVKSSKRALRADMRNSRTPHPKRRG